MRKLTPQQKVDIGLFLLLVLICISTTLVIRDNSEIAEINLTKSKLLCPKVGHKFQWSFVQNGEEYYFGLRYDSCDEFIDQFVGKEILGTYLVSNGSIIELTLDGKLVREASNTKLIYMGIFLAFVVFAFSRKLVKRLVSKYV